MKIERNDLAAMCRFDEIANGDVFIDSEGDVCMKMENISDGYACEDFNAVLLETGSAIFFDPFERVTLPRSVKLVIE